MKVMLDEIARKQAEAEAVRAEEQRRAEPRDEKRDASIPVR
jgi:hypothetical protein